MCGNMGRLRVILFILIVYIYIFFFYIFACYRFSIVLVCFGCFSVF